MVRPPVVKAPIIRVRSGKILDLAIFSSQEALSLHFSFKLGVTINLLSSIGSLLILNVLKSYVRNYVHTQADFTTAIQSGNETTQKLTNSRFWRLYSLVLTTNWRSKCTATYSLRARMPVF